VSVPDPVVCYAGARYDQTQEFHLDVDASLVAVDWMTSGRVAYGERWNFERYVARTTVLGPDGLHVRDVVRLCQEDGPLERRVGRFDVLALIIVAGRRLAAERDGLLETVARIRPASRPDIVMSAAPVPGAGCVLRVAGMHVEEVRRAVRALLSFVPSLLGDDPWERKW
jgi:urease accessory protein